MALSLLLLSGCAVGPDFARPKTPETAGFTAAPLPIRTAASAGTAGAAQRFVQGLDIPGQWWAAFHAPKLDALIRRAMAASPTVDAAQAALRQARENVAAAQGSYYPTVQAGFSPSRNKTATGSLSPASASGNPYYSLYTAQLSIAYVPDVFGGTRRQVESLEALADTQYYQLEATILTLTANLAAAAVQEASLRAQIAATQELVRIETEQLGILQKQAGLGQISAGDAVALQAVLAQLQASVPPLRKQLAQQRDLIAALSGVSPSEQSADVFTLEDFALPTELPVSLPSSLVAQRPDILAAEAQLHAASAQIGVALANELPNISLTGNGGTAATTLTRLFAAGTGFWGLAANLTQTVFDGGTLLHRRRAADAAYDQAAAQYRNTVITAFQNVGDALAALQADADALAAAVTAEGAAGQSLAITKRQLELGAINYLGVLTTEQLYQQAALSLVQARANRLADTAALFQALGGGWWNRAPEGAPAAPKG